MVNVRVEMREGEKTALTFQMWPMQSSSISFVLANLASLYDNIHYPAHAAEAKIYFINIRNYYALKREGSEIFEDALFPLIAGYVSQERQQS